MLMEECKELTQRLEQLRESQRQVTASNRTEMDRIMIIMEESLKAEINWAEERIKAKRKLQREMQSFRTKAESDPEAEVEAAEFLFDSLSAPGLTTVTAGEAASVTVANSSDYNYAISSIELHRSHPSQWQVEVLNNIGFGIVLGIIGKKKPTASPSFQDVTCFGWSSSINVYVAGTAQWAVCSWDGWKTGDKGIFTYSPSEATLSLRLLRGGSIRDFYIDKCSLPDGAFIHLFVQYGAAVRFSRVV